MHEEVYEDFLDQATEDLSDNWDSSGGRFLSKDEKFRLRSLLRGFFEAAQCES